MRQRFIRGLATLAGLALAGTGLVTTTAAPAAADNGGTNCPAGYWCGWKSKEAIGTPYKTKTSVKDFGSSWANKLHSFSNRTKLIACEYSAKNYEIAKGYFPDDPGTSGEWHGGTDETVNSVKLVATERECSGTAYPTWFSETSSKALGFGDLNGDRRADLLTRDKAGRLWFSPGDGTGRLVGNGGWNGMSALTRHGDFTGDGREDLVAREKSTDKLWLYPGKGDGGLGTRKLIGNGGWNGMNAITAVGDLTGDKRADLVAVQTSTGKLYLYPGTSGGGLGARKLIGNGGWNAMNKLVGVGDANGDGRPDLYAREKATGKLWLYPGRASALGSRVLIGTGGWNAREDIVGVGDISGDGRPDLVTVTNEKYVLDGFEGNPGWLVTYKGLGNGKLAGGVRGDGEWWLLNGLV
ncbi:FG-GAP-like repeat-containing protein [Streptomyces sp. NPDC047046]|uniref:FG-GAP-like repeat-containing protein n=1 Tax=Streptomyces sp. NPDC047046 TaxID=3155378 RepID=UPI0033D22A03